MDLESGERRARSMNDELLNRREATGYGWSFETEPESSSAPVKPSVYQDEVRICGVPALRAVTTLFVLIMIYEAVVFASGMCTWVKGLLTTQN